MAYLALGTLATLRWQVCVGKSGSWAARIRDIVQTRLLYSLERDKKKAAPPMLRRTAVNVSPLKILDYLYM